MYTGFRKKSAGVVQFDTTQNHFLAVGEENQIKFWDMDNNNILTSTEADGGLPVSIMCFVFCNFCGTFSLPTNTRTQNREEDVNQELNQHNLYCRVSLA